MFMTVAYLWISVDQSILLSIYHIVDEVRLYCIDYESFSEDLLIDRAFLDHYQGPHTKDAASQCILVRYWNQADGVLVVP